MNGNTTSKGNNVPQNDFPCYQCMGYLSKDLKKDSSKQRDTMEILYYLQNISDPLITKKILHLLRNLSQL